MTAAVGTSRRAASPPRDPRTTYELRPNVERDLLQPLIDLQYNRSRKDVVRDADGRATGVLETPAWPWSEYQRRCVVAIQRFLEQRSKLLPDEVRLGDELTASVMDSAGLAWKQTAQSVTQPGPRVLGPA